MTQWKARLLGWMVSDTERKRVKTKFELKSIELELKALMGRHSDLIECVDELRRLISRAHQMYSEYLLESGINPEKIHSAFTETPQISDWREHLLSALGLHAWRSGASESDLQQAYLNYYRMFQVLKSYEPETPSKPLEPASDPLHLLSFDSQDQWLGHLIALWNEKHKQHQELRFCFDSWTSEQIRLGLNYMHSHATIDLANALFFYKLFPERLFNRFMHPEKLVSVGLRLHVLHQIIERIQKQLMFRAQQLGDDPGVDYFFHGDDLPQGIMIDVSPEINRVIQSAIKHITVISSKESEHKINMNCLHDLRLSYKFWFNPDRFIDASMLLHQRLVGNTLVDELNLSRFQREMRRLYGHWTSSECLDLYGYYANHDTRYLMYILSLIINGHSFPWLPDVKPADRAAVKQVYEVLKCVMEALRDELRTRHVLTEPFVYDLDKKEVHAGRRNREAVKRLIAIYNASSHDVNETVEALFARLEHDRTQA